MAVAQMTTTLAMMMAIRGVMCEQTLTEQEDRLFAGLRLPDIFMSVKNLVLHKDPEPKFFLAPTWSEVNSAEEPHKRGKLTAQRAKYYSGLIIWTVIGTMGAGVSLLAANHAVQQRRRAADYVALPTPTQQQATTEQGRILRKARVMALFLGHVGLLTIFMLSAARSGELTPRLGLSWERWWFLVACGCVWATLQALWAVLTCQPTAGQFSAATFPTAVAVYMFPVVSDGFDTTKDVAFIGTLMCMPATWLHVLGGMCLLWLVSLYVYMIWTDNEAEDAVLMTFASVWSALNKQVAQQQTLTDPQVADQSPADEDPQAASTSRLSMAASLKAAKEKALVVAFFQTTRQKRKVLLLEDGVQGACAILTIVGTGAGIRAFFFIFVMNIALPAVKWVFGWAFHALIADMLQDWLSDEAEVARKAGLTARFHSLQAKLVDMTEFNVRTEQWFPPGAAVSDSHARLVAWSLQDREARNWVIKDRACRISAKGWAALMASDASQDSGLRGLGLDNVKDLNIDALAAGMAAKECSLQTLVLLQNNIGVAGMKALAQAISKQDSSLRELVLKNNNLDDAGAMALADAIGMQERGLAHLDLQEAGIGEKGAVALAAAIGRQDRFYYGLRAKLADIAQLNVGSEEVWFPGSIPVEDGHAYLVAWAVKDSGARKWVIKDREACHVSRMGWEALMVMTDSSSQDSGLRELVLDGVKECNIEGLAAAMATKDSSLRKLVLEKIGFDGVQQLAHAIAKQECGLTHLDVVNSGIGSAGAAALADAIKLQDCSLRKLGLAHNPIGESGEEALANAVMKQECGLTQLDLTNTGASGTHIARAIGHKDCSLLELVLACNQTIDVAELANAVMKKECSLQTLELSKNSIGDELKALANAIAMQECGLTQLDIAETGCGRSDAENFAVAIGHKDCNLRKLRLANNPRIGGIGLEALAFAIAKEDCPLQELDLDGIDMSISRAQALSKAIVKHEDRFKSLSDLIDATALREDSENLWFDGTMPVTDGHARCIARILQVKNRAKRWLISDRRCDITKKGWEALMDKERGCEALLFKRVSDLNLDDLVAAMLAKECPLRELEISLSNVGDAGAKTLAEGIAKQECELTHLDLWRNGIGPDGAGALAKAISLQECKLEKLELSRNSIGPDGAEALAKAISLKDCSLTCLCLGVSNIGDAGAKALAEAVAKQDCSLVELKLDSNGIGDAGARAFMRAISNRESRLERLDLSNHLTYKVMLNELSAACKQQLLDGARETFKLKLS